MPEDWRKDLDSKLSFTETDSRRTRVTYEMIEESGMLERAKAALEAGAKDFIQKPIEASHVETLLQTHLG